jgi:hypothetical protein
VRLPLLPGRTLTNLAATDANRPEILREGAATVLAALLRGGGSGGAGGSGGGGGAPADRACRHVAARALQNLSKCRQGPARRAMLVRGSQGLLGLGLQQPGFYILSCAPIDLIRPANPSTDPSASRRTRPLQDAGCVPALAGALALDVPTASAALSALCALCAAPRGLAELARADGAGALLSALGRLPAGGRAHRLALRLLRRLAKSNGTCRVRVHEALAGMGQAGLALS